MSPFHWFALITLIGISLTSVGIAFKYRKSLQSMSGMIMAMYLGMNVGLTAGMIFGTVYQGDLFFSTIISMVFGMSTGLLLGLVFGILAGIEGLMAGLMGGMMGAMLSEMLLGYQSAMLINIFLALSFTSPLLILIFPSEDTKSNFIKNATWFMKPLLSLLIICLYLLFGSQLSQQIITKSTDHTTFKKDNLVRIDVATSELRYSPSNLVVEKNQTVLLFLDNKDQTDHDFQIKTIPVNVAHANHGSHKNQKSDLHLHVNPGSSSEITFTPLQSGTYEFYCSIEGHKENGMVGTLVVN